MDARSPVIASAGEIWLADRGDAIRREVCVLSDARFHRLAERAVIASILDVAPGHPRPWHITLDDGRTLSVNLLGTLPTDRLLERLDVIPAHHLRRARVALHAILG